MYSFGSKCPHYQQLFSSVIDVGGLDFEPEVLSGSGFGPVEAEPSGVTRCSSDVTVRATRDTSNGPEQV